MITCDFCKTKMEYVANKGIERIFWCGLCGSLKHKNNTMNKEESTISTLVLLLKTPGTQTKLEQLRKSFS